MNKFKIIISIFLISLLMSCSKSIQVVPLKNTDMQIKKNGMIYFLPQTALEIEFTVTRNVFTAGPYAEYAEKYLSIEGTQTEDKDFYEISNITINPIAIPDPNAVFFICGNSKEKLKLNLTYNNIIKSVNIKSNDIEKAETNNSKSASFSYLNQDIKFLDYTVKRNFLNIQDTTYRVIKTDSVYQKIPVINTFISSKDIEQKAEEAANFIIKTRKRRFKVLTGQTEYKSNGKAFELMIENLDKIEQKYLSLFIGVNKTYTETYRSFYIPNEDSKSTGLFWFSEDKGVSFEKDEEASQVCVEVQNMESTAQISKFYNRQTDLKTKKTGLYYRIPGNAEIKLKIDNKILISEYYNIAQFGVINWIDSKLVSKKNFQVEFDTDLGSLKHIY